MRIKEIFSRGIDRHINPAVVVGDDKKEVIDAEIGEYVFTRDLVTNIYKMLDTILNGRNGKTGIWINGYFGSGKSHFLKFVNYCLHPKYKKTALDHLEAALSSMELGLDDVTPAQIRKLRQQIESIEIDTILFNVDNVSGDQANERMARIFLNQFNKFRGYNATNIPLARLLEKELDKAGVFEQFKQKLQERNFNWVKDCDTISRLRLDTVLGIAAELMPDISTEVLKTSLKNPATYHISIGDTLIPEFQEYLAGKDKNYRLVFLVDEVSQYIGRNKDLLLNLQTIVEMVSEYLNNQVWVACTAQQDLAEVVHGVDSVDHRDEFGKILGRFDTRISLESNDPTYITQKRVLDKKSDGIKALQDLYKSNKDAIEHQFNLNSSLYKGYNSEDDFQLSYPFVPYQFKLIGDVLDAFQQLRFVITQVKDNARSVIGITHFTAKQYADREVGCFVPFDAFLNEQLQQNMQHIGTRALNRPLELSWIKKSSFEERVVKTLFMISNLSHSVIQTFPPTLENMTILMMSRLDENRLELQKKIRDVLTRLKEENMIREEDGRFFFYNEDEINVTNLIRSRHVGAEERYSRLDTIFRSKRMLNFEAKFSIGKNDFRLGYWVDDKEVFRNGDIKVSFHVTDNQPLETKYMHTPADELVVGVNEWFAKDETLRKDFEWFCKTEAYLGSNEASAATGERETTNQNFRSRTDLLYKSILDRFVHHFAATRYISQQKILEASEINGTSPKERFYNALEQHLLGVYSKMQLAGKYAFTEQELRVAVRNPQTSQHGLTPAETVVNDFISTCEGNAASVQDIIAKFEKRPFGWRHTQVIEILAMLYKNKVREFRYNNEPKYPLNDFVEKAINTKERSRCIVCGSDVVSPEELDKAREAFRTIFNHDLQHTTDSAWLHADMIDWLKQSRHAIKANLDQFYGKYPFGVHLHHYDELLKGWEDERNERSLFTALVSQQDTAKEVCDAAKATQDFISRMLEEYLKIERFVKDNTANFSLLSPEQREQAEELVQYLKSDKPYAEIRHKRKLAEELKKAIDDLVRNLQAEATEQYNKVFDELEQEADKRKVDRITALPDRSVELEKIKKNHSISGLSLLKAKVSDFKTEGLQTILKQEGEAKAAVAKKEGKEVKVAEPVTLYVSRIKSTISNESELSEFLDKLKTDMLKLLQENKTIIIKE